MLVKGASRLPETQRDGRLKPHEVRQRQRGSWVCVWGGGGRGMWI
jgi:hypothetical protein